MITAPDFRALCAELVDKLYYHASEHSVDELITRACAALVTYELITRACAALVTPPPEPPTDEELDDFIMFWWGSNAEEQTITDAIECGLMAAFARDILPKLKQK